VREGARGRRRLLLAVAIGDLPSADGAGATRWSMRSHMARASCWRRTRCAPWAPGQPRIFATAPFFGAALAVPILGERFGVAEAGAGVVMAAAVALLIRERHVHEHIHEPFTHEHRHVHDEHHRHDHPAGTSVVDAHSHVHSHEPVRHSHAHVSDVHHRHRH
jgi:hypothetical protein